MAISSHVLFSLLVFVAFAGPIAEAQIPRAKITGTVYCSTDGNNNGTSSPVFRGALVVLRCRAENIFSTMLGGIRKVLTHGSLLKNGVLQHIRLVNPVIRPLLFSRYESAVFAREEEHGFERTTISDILKSKGKSADGSWLWCLTDDSVYDAFNSMIIQHNVGALVVVKPGERKSIAGIITEREYLRKIIVLGRSSNSTKVGDIMTEENKLISVTPETKVLKAMQLMTDNCMRHIPVVINNEGMIGMVSIVDVASAMLSELRKELKTHTYMVVTERRCNDGDRKGKC